MTALDTQWAVSARTNILIRASSDMQEDNMTANRSNNVKADDSSQYETAVSTRQQLYWE